MTLCWPASALLIPAGVVIATPAGFTRLAASAPPGQLGRTMGAAEAGREMGDAVGPVVAGAFGLVSLTAGLGALAAALLICAGLVAPRNRASAPSPRSVAREHRPTSSPFPHQRGDPVHMTTSRITASAQRRRCRRPETRPSRSRRSDG